MFADNNFYHIYNRGVEKRKIFIDKRDHYRFIKSLFMFNDEQGVVNFNYGNYGSETSILP